MNALRLPRRIKALVAAKLGRCAMCMRRSFVGAAVATCALAGAQVLWHGSLVWLAALVTAVALTALWVAHVAAFAIRSLPSRDGLARTPARGSDRGSAAVVTRKQALVSSVGLAVLVSLPGEAAARQNIPNCPPLPACGCQYHKFAACGGGSYCDLFACKSHGCFNGRCHRPCAYPAVGSKDAARALGLYFQAYRDPVSRGSGRPRSSLLNKATSVSLQPHARAHFELQRITHTALYATLGPAFDGSGLDTSSAKCAVFGNIRGISDTKASVALVDATHRALDGVFRDGVLDGIEPEIRTFWDSHPQYDPLFDPCWRRASDPREFQIAKLTDIGSALLACRG